jgi:hypothetical protein
MVTAGVRQAYLSVLVLAIVFALALGSGALLGAHDRTWATVLGVILGCLAGLVAATPAYGAGGVETDDEEIRGFRPGAFVPVLVILLCVWIIVTGFGSWYEQRYGRPVAATVDDRRCVSRGPESSECATQYHLVDGTGRGLGWTYSCENPDLHIGDTVPALADPRGWYTATLAACPGSERHSARVAFGGFGAAALVLVALDVRRVLRGQRAGGTVPPPAGPEPVRRGLPRHATEGPVRRFLARRARRTRR